MENKVKLYRCYKATCNKCLNEENPYITEDEYNELLDADGKISCPEGHIECGIQELTPEDYAELNSPKDKKKWYLLGGGILVVMLIVGAIFIFSGKSKSIAPNVSIKSPTEIKETVPIEKPVSAGEETSSVNNSAKEPTVDKEKPGNVKKTETSVKPLIGSGIKTIKTLNFSFGYYKGETLNDLMHGIGTLYFEQSQIISSKDPKKRIAEAGDNVNGTWFEGYLDQGKWYNKSGEIKGVINIGH